MNIRRTAILALCLMLFGSMICALPSGAQGTTFHLRAEHEGQGDPGTALTRRDVQRSNDPFSGEPEDDPASQSLDVPAAAFLPGRGANDTQRSSPYSLNAQQGTPLADPGDLGSEGDMGPPQRQPGFDPTDPDSSPAMKIAWDAWHRRVAQTIFERFSFFSKAAFKRSAPLMCNITYQVTNSGHIVNMNVQQKSTNVLFNVLVYQAIKSLDGDLSVLAFPPGSKRKSVAKAGSFTQNYGQEGFRHTTNDVEQLKQR